jgi:hypothetical protein
MTTSGTTTFSQTKIEVIQDAFNLLGVYGNGYTISAEDEQVASRFLNKMVKSWGARGLHLWTKQECVLYLDQYVGKYTLGANGTYCTTKDDEVITNLNGGLTNGATSVIVDSTTGMTVGDYIGIVLTSRDIHWTTIATIPNSTSLTLTLGVTDSAPDNANVYTFTTRINKPLRITSARRVYGVDNGATSTKTEVAMASIAYQDYFEIGSQTSSGTPNQFSYTPKNTDGTLYLWPRPNDTSYRIEFSAERIIEDLNAVDDDFDFPSEWLEPLTWQLALRLAPAFDRENKAGTLIAPIAQSMFENLLNWDTEITSVYFSPDYQDY